MTTTESRQRVYDARITEASAERHTVTFLAPDGVSRTFDSKISTWSAGVIGCLLLPNDGTGNFGFMPYPDQRLRRRPDQDIRTASPIMPTLLGWELDGETGGHFCAPEGIIPGTDGRFIEDLTEEVEIAIPPEFAGLCESRGLTPEQVLRGFVADVCALQNHLAEPRQDGYRSNGSDERSMAMGYFNRAFGASVPERSM